VCEACATTAVQNVFSFLLAGFDMCAKPVQRQLTKTFFLVCEQGVICVRSLCNDSCPTCEDPAFKTSESGRDLLLVLTLECKTLGMVVARYTVSKVYLGSMSRDVHSSSHWLGPCNPPPPRIWAHVRGALLVN
jgi:hypothetical protein